MEGGIKSKLRLPAGISIRSADLEVDYGRINRRV